MKIACRRGSYDGLDANDYYRLKELNEDRKRDLVKAKEEQEELVQGELKEEAIKAVQKAESRADASAPFNSIANTIFHLYRVD